MECEETTQCGAESPKFENISQFTFKSPIPKLSEHRNLNELEVNEPALVCYPSLSYGVGNTGNPQFAA